MTIHYTTLPHAYWHGYPKATDFLAKTVHEAEPSAPVKTGLLDASGTPIYRVETREPVGFIRHGGKR